MGKVEAKSFTFDSVFDSGEQSEAIVFLGVCYPYLHVAFQIFDACSPLIRSAVQGYNATIFACETANGTTNVLGVTCFGSDGCTGSGKTYTMYGTPERAGLYHHVLRLNLFLVFYKLKYHF